MLELDNISKQYAPRRGAPLSVLENITLRAAPGERVAIVGPSGCGKSTLLKIVAGLLAPTAGEARVSGARIIGPGVERGFMVQHLALFPWLTVRENISFGPKLKNMAPGEQRALEDYFLKITALELFADFYPKALSGGMQQRVALARTLANSPRVLLLDEPFGALDAATRREMHQLLLTVLAREPRTLLLVTHDVSEAIFLSDTVYVLSSRPGTVQKKITIALPKLRPEELEYAPEFLMLKKELQGALRPLRPAG